MNEFQRHINIALETKLLKDLKIKAVEEDMPLYQLIQEILQKGVQA